MTRCQPPRSLKGIYHNAAALSQHDFYTGLERIFTAAGDAWPGRYAVMPYGDGKAAERVVKGIAQ